MEFLKPVLQKRRGHALIFDAVVVSLVTLILACCFFIVFRMPSLHDSPDKIVDDKFLDDTYVSESADSSSFYDDCQFSDEILSMAKGVDITKLDLIPMTLSDIGSNPGSKAQLIKLSCTSNLIKLDSNGNLISRIPDQFMPNSYATISAFGTSANFEEHTERNTRDSKISAGLTFGISLLKLGMFSSSASYEHKKKQMVFEDNYISEMKIFSFVRSAEFRPATSRLMPLEGNDEFQSVVDNLASTFEADPTAYLDLLSKYGTHYFALARFGGFVKITTEVTKLLRRTMTMNDIEAKLTHSYKLLKTSMNFDLFQNLIREDFREMTSTSKYSHGGDPSLAYGGDLTQWIRSISKSPSLIGGKLEPINILVRNSSKSAEVAKAIQVYLGMAYVKDLKSFLNLVRSRGIGHPVRQSSLAVTLRTMTYAELQNETRLTELGIQVTQSLRRPSYGPVTISVFRGEFLQSLAPANQRCNKIETGIYARRRENCTTVYEPIREYTTEEFSSSSIQFNEVYHFNLELDAVVQFCLYSKSCNNGTTGIIVANESYDCADSLSMFVQKNRQSDVEKMLRLDDFTFVYNIYWEPIADQPV